MKYKKIVPEFPKNIKEEGHKNKVQAYLTFILSNKEMREEEEVKRIFKLKQFYDVAQKEEKLFEAVHVPE